MRLLGYEAMRLSSYQAIIALGEPQVEFISLCVLGGGVKRFSNWFVSAAHIWISMDHPWISMGYVQTSIGSMADPWISMD